MLPADQFLDHRQWPEVRFLHVFARFTSQNTHTVTQQWENHTRNTNHIPLATAYWTSFSSSQSRRAVALTLLATLGLSIKIVDVLASISASSLDLKTIQTQHSSLRDFLTRQKCMLYFPFIPVYFVVLLFLSHSGGITKGRMLLHLETTIQIILHCSDPLSGLTSAH